MTFFPPRNRKRSSLRRSQLGSQLRPDPLAAFDGAASMVDRKLWTQCAELGWFGLGMTEALGGVGYTLVEEALLFTEIGAHATPGPFLATVLGARMAALAGSNDLVPGSSRARSSPPW